MIVAGILSDIGVLISDTGMWKNLIEFGILLFLAALGEIIAEKSGVLNLGVEGMMAVGAMTGYWAGIQTGSPWLAAIIAAIAVALFASLHGVVSVVLGADQVVSGLALTILGLGLAAFLGTDLVSQPPGASFDDLALGSLSELPGVGPTLFSMDPMGWVALVLGCITWFVINRTRAGLNLRAVGESAATADAAGTPVVGTRLVAVAIGGAFAGLAGAYLTLKVTPSWNEAIVGGLGWIAVALVIFGAWRPARVLVGALLFGGLIAVGPRFQTRRCKPDEVTDCITTEINPILVSMLPYLLTILVLVLLSIRSRNRPSLAPAAIGQAYRREER